MADLVARIALEKHATAAQAALAWLLAEKPWIVPIPRTTKEHRLLENLAAMDVELTTYDLLAIDRAASEIEVQGARYSPSAQARIDR